MKETTTTCVMLIEQDTKSILDSEHIPNAINLFVDGSSFYEQGHQYTGWAVVNEHGETIDCGSLTGGGAQVAELVALTRALTKGKGVTAGMLMESHRSSALCGNAEDF